MSEAPTTPARLTVSAQRKRQRVLIDRAFRLAGFAATFFGLGMLVVFLLELGIDTVTWFNTMPALIQERNAEIQQRVDEAEQIVKAELAKIEKEKQLMMAGAATAEEKKEIEEFYAQEVLPVKREQLQQRMKEYEHELQFVRTDTSPAALTASFLTNGPSSQPQDAGIKPALIGSLLLVGITALLAVPLGVGAAIYLEEYKSNWLADFLERNFAHVWGYWLWGAWFVYGLRALRQFIQLNITNLAGVPSVVFGILGAFVFVGFFHVVELRQAELEAGAPLASDLFGRLLDQIILWLLQTGYPVAARNVLGGGMTLALLTLPIVIVASQEAIRAVPQSIRHGAYALGATHWQVTWTVVLPNAIPGILTGTILSMSRAIGEAAPLVLFGALLFVDRDPNLFSRFTILPMQIFGWADRPEDAWRYNAAVASVVLMVSLLMMNAVAIFLRQRGQRHMKW